MTYNFHINWYSFEYGLLVKVCVTKVVLTSSLTLRSHLCLIVIVNCGKTHFLFFQSYYKYFLSFVLSVISSIIIEVFTDMIQGPYVVEISRRVDTLGSVLFQIPDWLSYDFNKSSS